MDSGFSLFDLTVQRLPAGITCTQRGIRSLSGNQNLVIQRVIVEVRHLGKKSPVLIPIHKIFDGLLQARSQFIQGFLPGFGLFFICFFHIILPPLDLGNINMKKR